MNNNDNWLLIYELIEGQKPKTIAELQDLQSDFSDLVEDVFQTYSDEKDLEV